MSNPIAAPVAAATSLVKAPFGWAKARPVVFIVFVLVVAILAIKFAPKILAFFAKVPAVGGRVVAFAQPAQDLGA